VFPRYKAVILAHGCFWHGHNCPLFKWPSSNVKFWKTKIEHNREVDRTAREALVALGWRILTVWECTLKGPGKLPAGRVVEEAARWLSSGGRSREVVGREKR
jgi:DNA mismatch endonuclease (patch repair protein)